MLLELELKLVVVEAAGIRFLLQKYGDRFLPLGSTPICGSDIDALWISLYRP